MSGVALAVSYALFLWWFSTGLVFLLVLRSRRILPLSLLLAALLVPVSLYGLAHSSADPTVFGAYAAFTSAIVLWGTQEIGFLTGFVTGPRPLPCPTGLTLPARAAYAVAAILYHELALALSGLAAAAVTWGGVNQVGGMTFLILWVMRLSAKLNLFLGVPVLNDGSMPDALVFLRSYFVRSRATCFFPFAVGLALAAFACLVACACFAGTDPARAGGCLLATLLGLAVLEHAFMMFRLPVDALWSWSTRSGRPATDVLPDRERSDLASLERRLPT